MIWPPAVQRVKTPMSLAKIRRNIDSQAYSGEPVEAGMALPTEAGMALFLRDLALIEYNCKRFNRVREATSHGCYLKTAAGLLLGLLLLDVMLTCATKGNY